jgi:hypothetical protein
MKDFEKLLRLKKILEEETSLEWTNKFDERSFYINDIIDLDFILEKYDIRELVDVIYFSIDDASTLIYIDLSNNDKWLNLLKDDDV